jgi:hypothetical protein
MQNKFRRILLHKDSLLLAAILFLIWFTTSMLVEINYDFKKLHRHTGEVTNIQVAITRIINKPLYKDTTRQLQIGLAGETQYFSLSGKTDFEQVMKALAEGDSATVFTKDKVAGIFGYGDDHTIAHLVKHPTNQILIDFIKRQRSGASVILLPPLLAIILLAWYIVKVRRRIWWELGGYEKNS